MSQRLELTAVILAGGAITQSLAESSTKPALLTKFIGNTLLYYLVKQLERALITHIVICANTELVDALEAKFGHELGGVKLDYSREDVPCGTGGALIHAKHLLDTDELLILNGDAYLAFDLSRFIDWYLELPEAEVGMLLAEVEEVQRFGRVLFYDDNMIYRFEETGKFLGPGLVNAGIYLIKRTVLERLGEAIPSSLEHHLFPVMVSERKMYCLPSNGKFIDIGSPECYATAEWSIRDRIQKGML